MLKFSPPFGQTPELLYISLAAKLVVGMPFKVYFYFPFIAKCLHKELFASTVCITGY